MPRDHSGQHERIPDTDPANLVYMGSYSVIDEGIGQAEHGVHGITEDDSSKKRSKRWAEIICRAGDEPAAALFVLMGTLEYSTQPKIIANTAKHFAFTCCGESNLFGMVDAQIAIVARQLLASNKFTS